MFPKLYSDMRSLRMLPLWMKASRFMLYGGEKSHIGAITIAGPGGQVNTTAFDGHKEAGLSQKWALAIAHKKGTSRNCIRGHSL